MSRNKNGGDVIVTKNKNIPFVVIKSSLWCLSYRGNKDQPQSVRCDKPDKYVRLDKPEETHYRTWRSDKTVSSSNYQNASERNN